MFAVKAVSGRNLELLKRRVIKDKSFIRVASDFKNEDTRCKLLVG